MGKKVKASERKIKRLSKKKKKLKKKVVKVKAKAKVKVAKTKAKDAKKEAKVLKKIVTKKHARKALPKKVKQKTWKVGDMHYKYVKFKKKFMKCKVKGAFAWKKVERLKKLKNKYKKEKWVCYNKWMKKQAGGGGGGGDKKGKAKGKRL